MNHAGRLSCGKMWHSLTVTVYIVFTHLVISSLRIFLCVCVQTRAIPPPYLRNRGKEVVLAQAYVASGKADGSLLTIISFPIMLQERTHTLHCLPMGRSSYRVVIFKEPKHRTGVLIVYQTHSFSSLAIFFPALWASKNASIKKKATSSFWLDTADDTVPSF